ncbi:hypothetical protein R5R35_002532 [Gryllus longicercus]|uniref:Dihydrolipoamide acetyltransferase component of pyruvate dehydrogenase complex n=1 Tax=Gryllus longicercus TaxID=2509291 RepID=A0AAN9VP50_9ORTH
MARLIKRLTSAAMGCSAIDKIMVKPCVNIKKTSLAFPIYRGSRFCSRHVCTVDKLLSISSHRKYTSAPRIVPFKLSDIGEGIREVTVKEWFVKVGDKVSQFDNICEVQSDKASVTITSRYDGTITKLHYNIDDTALVGDPLVDLEVFDNSTTASGGSSQENADIQTAETTEEVVDFGSKILATPAVRRLASEEKIDLKNVSGTGRHGRILKEDVLTYLEDRKKTRMHSEETRKSKEFLNVKTSDTLVSSESNVQKKPIQGFSKAMVKTMTAANMIPHFMYSDEINVTKISNIIEELKQIQTPVKFTFMPFFIKAASNSLLKFPLLNSSVDEKCEHILYKSSHNIGVAMDTPAGLVVPNIKNVEKLSILEVAQELKRLHHSGLANSLRPSDLTGGTFTLSNIGSIGGKYTLPVVLPPEVAIGGIGAVQIVPRFDELGNVVKAKVICISWAADHRIIDGATIARFSNLWKSYIENPYKLLLNV